jgi:hypothetical protein
MEKIKLPRYSTPSTLPLGCQLVAFPGYYINKGRGFIEGGKPQVTSVNFFALGGKIIAPKDPEDTIEFTRSLSDSHMVEINVEAGIHPRFMPHFERICAPELAKAVKRKVQYLPAQALLPGMRIQSVKSNYPDDVPTLYQLKGLSRTTCELERKTRVLLLLGLRVNAVETDGEVVKVSFSDVSSPDTAIYYADFTLNETVSYAHDDKADTNNQSTTEQVI